MGLVTTLAGKANIATPNSLWDALSEQMGDIIPTKEKAVSVLMDAIITSTAVKAAFEATMLGTSAYAAARAQRLKGSGNSGVMNQIASGIVDYGFGSVLSFLSVAFTGDLSSLSAVLLNGGSAEQSFYDQWQKATIMPNIEGIPISSSTVVSDREVDVGEQMMIVQSSTKKQYWTDNAVPHLKTWTLEGYMMTQLMLDTYYIAKPSLRMQHEFLDICATSRRPVLFKDNKGDFRFVQITSLHTEEVADYNNGIKVTIHLKEYKPFQVQTLTNITKSATQDKSSIAGKVIKG